MGDPVEENESTGEDGSKDFSADRYSSGDADHESAVSAESETQSEGVQALDLLGLDSVSSREEVLAKDLGGLVEDRSEDSHLNPDNGIVASEEMGGQEVEAPQSPRVTAAARQ